MEEATNETLPQKIKAAARQLECLIDPEAEAFWRLGWRLPWVLAAASAGIALFLASSWVVDHTWILNGANLIIHEAGHPVFGVFGLEFLAFLGGTLMQLIMPLLFFGSFLRTGQPKSADICLAWTGHNFLHIGRYAADARAQTLPLIGGGEHDWNYMLGRLGLLNWDTFIGRTFDLAGALLIAIAAFSILLRLKQKPPEETTGF